MTHSAEQSHTRTADLTGGWFANLTFYKDGASELTLRNCDKGQRISLTAEETARFRELLNAAQDGTLL